MAKNIGSGTLSTGLKLGFGVCDLGGNLFFTFIGFYLLVFLTDVLKLNAGLAGTALMIGKIWDAAIDPAVGFLSDRTRSRWGRRKPYMLAGCLAVAGLMFVMFSHPRISSQGLLFLWVVVVYCLLNSAYSLLSIPYGSLTPDLTRDFHERTVLNGFKMTFAVIGTIAGAVSVLPLISSFGGGDKGWLLTAGFMGIVVLVTAVVTILTVPDKVVLSGAQSPKSPFSLSALIKDCLAALRSIPYLTSLLAWTFFMTGVNVVQSSLFYYYQYIYNSQKSFGTALLILLVTTMLFIPVWVLVSRKLGKKESYIAGMGLFAISAIVFYFLGPVLGIKFSFIMMFIVGMGFATHYVIPWSILPDVVEYDHAESAVRREGVFYGMWAFVSKMGQALAIAICGWVLNAFGYIPPGTEGPVVQSGTTIQGIRLLSGPIPAAFIVLGIAALVFYPINAKAYALILKKSRKRKF